MINKQFSYFKARDKILNDAQTLCVVNAIVGLSIVLNLAFCKRQRQCKQQYSYDTQGAIQQHSIINYTYRRKQHRQ
jgi:hypothetical protein